MEEQRDDVTRWVPIPPEELAARLSARRRARGMSLRAAAVEIGVSAATLSRVERGDYLPERNSLFRLVSWLGLAVAPPAAEPHPPGADTMEAIELHLRADRELSRDDADAIAQMVRLAYERLRGSGG
ncbi:MAG: helix-turn-helix domain-containing protein [Solirubrobacteraceae bacterium]